ncbi:amidase [Priestia aryabhattai]|uniref:hypothetical protein n=1 Tax=Priestia aryabhattai TaxID=412384 RepID=UPI003681148A
MINLTRVPVKLDWYTYASNYHNAATALYNIYKDGKTSTIVETKGGPITIPPNEIEDVMYPILFSYRHSVEIYLKMFSKMKHAINGEPVHKLAEVSGHSLSNLWREAEDFLDILTDKGVQKARIAQIKNNIHSFMNSADLNSFTFRYPTKKLPSGRTTAAKPSININTFNLENYVKQTDSLLEDFNALWQMATNPTFLGWTPAQKQVLKDDYIIF